MRVLFQLSLSFSVATIVATAVRIASVILTPGVGAIIFSLDSIDMFCCLHRFQSLLGFYVEIVL